MRNLRFHATAIVLISVVITGLYFLVGQKPPAPEQPLTPGPGDRQVTILSATWGLNCNDYIRQTLEQQATPEPANNTQTPPTPAEKLTLVEQNNIKEKVSKRCNAQFSCSFRADAATIGFDPAPACFKELDIEYRCFSIDLLRTLKIRQGEPVKIDCRNETTPAAEAAPHAP